MEAGMTDKNIKNLYCDERLSATAIAKRFGVCYNSIYRRLQNMGIKTRNPSEARHLAFIATGGRSPKYIPLEAKLITDMYLLQELSSGDIAKIMGVTEAVVLNRLHEANCPIRTHQEAMKIAGRKCPNGENSRMWRGGRIKSSEGYILINEPEHHRRNKGGYVFEHILVWEQVHNKLLPEGWVIHHINGVKNDNRPCNLVAFPDKTHKRILDIKSQRIRELEAEVDLLKRTMEKSQSIFYINDN